MAVNARDKFTYHYYREFLSRLRETYLFTTFKEGKRIVDKSDSPLLILRHDIDMDLEPALRMAAMENDFGICSTYFLMVSCPLYNVFSGVGAKQVRQILAAGHHFGLHFDCAIYNDISADNIDYYVSTECRLLENFFQRPAEAVSFHRPGSLELSGVTLKKLPNSYEMVFRERFQYFADSRGDWARGNPLESKEFSAKDNLHICIHPIWWTEELKTPYECLVDFVKRIRNRDEQYISENCGVWNEGKKLGRLG
jgi:hypothetical protein